MSLGNKVNMPAGLVIGQALPGPETPEACHLYVSLADMLFEQLGFHPAYEQVLSQLPDSVTSAIEALLGDDQDNNFVDRLVASISAAYKTDYRTVRISLNSACSDQLASLPGGAVETKETNPAMGLRGVSRFASAIFAPVFALECEVIKQLRTQGIPVEIVVPFVRTLSDAAKIIDLLAEQGLPRGLNGLKVHFAVDVPSAAVLADRLLHYFDGVVIDVENLAQFTLAVDRNNPALSYLYDPENDAVIELIELVVKAIADTHKPALVVATKLADAPKLSSFLAEQPQLELVEKQA
ncbi:putative PEP-binding protein [Vibrio sp.]|uniref:putative PEP-binding protein n=1 Tax=Vibrio sp. TaxID=678 RepID=UPI003D0B3CEF